MIYGYARVSTKGQAHDGNSLESQTELLKDNGAEKIYQDSFTGTKTDRPAFTELLNELKAGDTLAKGETKTLKIAAEYKQPTSADQLPSTNESYVFTLDLNYVQAD